jgi:hypothetical protein
MTATSALPRPSLLETPSEFGQGYLCSMRKKVWAHRGQLETPVIPDEPDAPDAGVVVDGVGVDGGFRAAGDVGERKITN